MCNDVCFLVFSECNKQRFGHLANKEGYPWSMFNFFQAMGLDLLVPFGPMPYTMKGKIMDWTQWACRCDDAAIASAASALRSGLAALARRGSREKCQSWTWQKAKGSQVNKTRRRCAKLCKCIKQQNDAVSPRRSKPSYYRACPEIPEQQRDTTQMHWSCDSLRIRERSKKEKEDQVGPDLVQGLHDQAES